MPEPGYTDQGDAKRRASDPTIVGVQNAISANIATVVFWIVVSVISLSPVTPPETVMKALEFLVTTAVAFFVGWVSAKRRDRQWHEERVITGLRRVL